MYQPTNVKLVLQADGNYIPEFDTDVKEGESVTEIANFMVENTRVIVFDVSGDSGITVVTIHVIGDSYERGTEEAVEFVVAKGGKVKGTTRASYA